nr:hypothetical protein [Bifidobacterium simiiventris]
MIAGALAAVTSFLLSAKIGMAGSVIGVAVGSIVSAVASQIYKNVLKASGEKLQDVTGVGSGSSDTADDAAKTPASDDRTQVIGDVTTVLAPGALAVTTVDDGRARRVVSSADEQIDDSTRVLGHIDAAARRPGVPATTPRSVISGNPASGRIGRDHALAAATASRQKRIAIVVAVVSALVAVAATAGIVMLVTQGKGTDSVVRDWVNTTQTPVQQTPDDTNGHQPAPTDPNTKTDESDTPANGADDTTTGMGSDTGSTDDANGTSTEGTTSGGSSSGTSNGSTGSGTSSDSSTNSGSTGSGTSNGTSGGAGSDTTSGSTGSSSGSSSSSSGDSSSSNSTGSGTSTSGSTGSSESSSSTDGSSNSSSGSSSSGTSGDSDSSSSSSSNSTGSGTSSTSGQ